MRKIYVVLLIICCTSAISGLAQSYIPLFGRNQYWEEFWSDPLPICGVSSGDIYYEGPDTIFGGEVFSIIYSKPIISTYSTSPFFYCPPYVRNDTVVYERWVREDTTTGKVFTYTSNGDYYLFYNFKASAGDTLHNYFGNGFGTITIDSVVPIFYPGLGIRKTFYINSGSSFGYYIEGIGGTNGLLNPIIPSVSPPAPYLSCVRDSTYNSIYGSCMSGVVGLKHQEKNKVRFYPNPVSGDRILTIEAEEAFEFNLFDMTGRKINSYQFGSGQKEHHISLQQIIAGIYTAEVVLKNSRQTVKLIVN